MKIKSRLRLLKRRLVRVERRIRSSEKNRFLFVAGAQKAGTTALFNYLSQHTQVQGVDGKEANYFDYESLYKLNLNYYHSLFPRGAINDWYLDATPNTLYYPICGERIKELGVEIKVIILIREPVSRALSAFNMYRQIINQPAFRLKLLKMNPDTKHFFESVISSGTEPTVKYFLEKEIELITTHESPMEPSLIRRGLYYPQISRLVNLFGDDSVLVITSNQLKEDRLPTLRTILDFLELQTMEFEDEVSTHTRKYETTDADRATIRELSAQYFEDDRLALRKIKNINPPW